MKNKGIALWQRIRRYVINLLRLNRWVFLQSLQGERLEALQNEQAGRATAWEARLEALQHDQAGRATAWEARLEALQHDQASRAAVWEARLEGDILQKVKNEVARQSFYHSMSLHQRLDQFFLDHQQEGAVRPRSVDHFMDEYYVAFEEAFRGSRESIVARYTPYLQLLDLSAVQTALDVGCGRGEWVELLSRQGIEAMGVDANTAMIKSAQKQGVKNLFCGDAVEFLSDRGDSSYDMISAFHVIEHLSLEALLHFLQQARRLLTPGGQLILETPDPENFFVSALTFHKDPTHQKPLPAEVISFMVSYLGFERVQSMKLHPFPEGMKLSESTQTAGFINEHFLGAQDYLLIATKAHAF